MLLVGKMPVNFSKNFFVLRTDLKLLEIKKRKAAKYKLTSPIFDMEQNIAFSLIYGQFSRILEILKYPITCMVTCIFRLLVICLH